MKGFSVQNISKGEGQDHLYTFRRQEDVTKYLQL